ncbi:hypothetical protein EVAR_10626_1 [Eumeta japonica]|uniref:Uncharacterized protein n=1 Tax=Eumeta variegata TaxID=151549 RepID=A0A4C1U228_EUMVA|nr:hypothetical protein EVAR_10626_1 [Eumeta japonica]
MAQWTHARGRLSCRIAFAVCSRLYALTDITLRYTPEIFPAHGFIHVGVEYISPYFLWKDLAVNSNLVFAFNAGPRNALDFYPGHALNFYADSILVFDPGSDLDFGLGLGYRFCVSSRIQIPLTVSIY